MAEESKDLKKKNKLVKKQKKVTKKRNKKSLPNYCLWSQVVKEPKDLTKLEDNPLVIQIIRMIRYGYLPILSSVSVYHPYPFKKSYPDNRKWRISVHGYGLRVNGLKHYCEESSRSKITWVLGQIRKRFSGIHLNACLSSRCQDDITWWLWKIVTITVMCKILFY